MNRERHAPGSHWRKRRPSPGGEGKPVGNKGERQPIGAIPDIDTDKKIGIRDLDGRPPVRVREGEGRVREAVCRRGESSDGNRS